MHFLRRASLRCVVDMANFSRGQELTFHNESIMALLMGDFGSRCHNQVAHFYSTLVKKSASVHECIEQLLGQISVK